MRTKFKRRLLSFALVVVMIATMVPLSALPVGAFNASFIGGASGTAHIASVNGLTAEVTGYSGGATNKHQRLEAQANLNFRLVEALMMIMLPLLAVALAVPPKRSSSGLGIFLGILIIVAYHKVNQYGQQAGAHGQINPILALWAPLVLFAAMIMWMYHVLAHRPGGQPIGALDRFFAGFAKLFRSLLPRRREAAEA